MRIPVCTYHLVLNCPRQILLSYFVYLSIISIQDQLEAAGRYGSSSKEQLNVFSKTLQNTAGSLPSCYVDPNCQHVKYSYSVMALDTLVTCMLRNRITEVPCVSWCIGVPEQAPSWGTASRWDLPLSINWQYCRLIHAIAPADPNTFVFRWSENAKHLFNYVAHTSEMSSFHLSWRHDAVHIKTNSLEGSLVFAENQHWTPHC